MKNKVVKRVLSVGLMAAMALTLLAGCGGKGDGGDKGNGGGVSGEGGEETDEFAGKDNNFKWWIYKTDGEGQYYENYEDCVTAQWLRAQSWDVKNGGISKQFGEMSRGK